MTRFYPVINTFTSINQQLNNDLMTKRGKHDERENSLHVPARICPFRLLHLCNNGSVMLSSLVGYHFPRANKHIPNSI